MKLRSKFFFFLGSLMAVLVVGLIYISNFYLDGYFRDYTLNNFRTLAGMGESSYLFFIKSLEIRTIDWSSDGHIRDTVEKILKTEARNRPPLVAALNKYLRKEKIAYDPNALIIDVLDTDGIVLASSRDERVGVDERKEELESSRVRFTEAIQADFGQTFVAPVIAETDEAVNPMIHATARIFSKTRDAKEAFVPLDAVLLVHFVNTARIRDALIGAYQSEKGKMTEQAPMAGHYKTADIYLVNKDRLMITPSRLGAETILKQRVETEPVTACLDRGKEVKGEYLDYRGQQVFGASACMEEDGLVLILEAESQEVLAPLTTISQSLMLIGGIALLLVAAGIASLSNWLLGGLEVITDAAKKITKGDTKERARVRTKDEIGYLAGTFNEMLDSIEKKSGELERTNQSMVGRELRMAELKKELQAIQSENETLKRPATG